MRFLVSDICIHIKCLQPRNKHNIFAHTGYNISKCSFNNFGDLRFISRSCIHDLQ